MFGKMGVSFLSAVPSMLQLGPAPSLAATPASTRYPTHSQAVSFSFTFLIYLCNVSGSNIPHVLCAFYEMGKKSYAK